MGYPDGSVVKNPPANSGDMQETQIGSLGREDHLEEEITSYSRIFALKKSHEERSLVGHNLWGHRKSDTTEPEA